MRRIQRIVYGILLGSVFLSVPAKSCDFTLMDQEFGIMNKASASYTFMNDSTKDIRKFLAKPEIKDLCALFQPTLQIEDSGQKITIRATHGAYDVARQVFGPFSILDKAPFEQLFGQTKQAPVPLDQLVPKGFNGQVYMLLNPDLNGYLPETQDRNYAALSHYLNYGRLEKRGFMPKEFNPESYLACNPDVREVAMQQKDPFAFAAMHRYVLAPQEDRPYLPTDFEADIYLKLYSDVQSEAAKTPNALEYAKQHFLRDGRHEKRSYKVSLPSDFSWNMYLNLNTDLYNAPALSSWPEHAVWHYTHFGYFEGRRYKKES